MVGKSLRDCGRAGSAGKKEHQGDGGDVGGEAGDHEPDGEAVHAGFAVAVVDEVENGFVGVGAELLGDPLQAQDAGDDGGGGEQDEDQAGDDEELREAVGAGDQAARKTSGGDDDAAKARRIWPRIWRTLSWRSIRLKTEWRLSRP